MKNYKIEIKNESQFNEVVELAVKIGYKKPKFTYKNINDYLLLREDGIIHIVSITNEWYKEITIKQLRTLAGEKKLMKLTDLTEKQVVNCATEEEAKRICKIAHEQGLKWHNGYSYLEVNYWEEYKEKTCYYFNIGAFADIKFHKQRGYEIIPSTQITEEPQPKEELKKVWAWDDDPQKAFQTYLIKEFEGFEYKYLCIYEECVKDFENKYCIDTATYKNISETDPRTPNDVLKIVEKYGKDKLITLIEKL